MVEVFAFLILGIFLFVFVVVPILLLCVAIVSGLAALASVAADVKDNQTK